MAQEVEHRTLRQILFWKISELMGRPGITDVWDLDTDQSTEASSLPIFGDETIEILIIQNENTKEILPFLPVVEWRARQRLRGDKDKMK
ncbi:unnamed protein product [Parnassius apollo]|uniref:(apollo) hypothetical protein n=1 Tax=Parnassius apollo TaxID=110799 RepID=A0A8S3Y2U7_PARAO|nr:unnamed protein product [Parnassius apollo]